MRQSLFPLLVALPALISLSLLFAVPGAASGPAIDQFPDPDQYEVGSREWLKASEALRYRPLGTEHLADNCPHSFDVINYDVTMRIDIDNQLIYGDTRVTSVSEEADLSGINLDLTALTVDTVLGGDDTLGFTHSDPVLSIDLGRSYAVGDTFQVRVIYHGQPGNEGVGGFGGFWFDGAPLMAYQMGVGLVADPPSMGKYWIPCWDWPCDKATADYRITVPGLGRKVVCNGTLVSATLDSVANTATYVWSETHEIAPHLMTVHARRYTELVDSTYSWIHYWVFPGDVDAANVHFQNVDVMMDGFIARYGPYPFSRFGYVAATKGDMEHQTCVTHNAKTIQANHLYDWLLAHEMSHQWWGDCVSVNDWRDVWLSEGFATYSEAVFQEYAYGMDAYRAYMQQSLMNPVLNSPENFPIYDPDYLWGTTVYEKGGCVLHMLRHVVGDSTFFAALAAYRQAHEYSSAVTPEFQEAVEAASGQELDWFFTEWIYDVGWPSYQYSWRALEAGGWYALNLVVDQVQTNGPVFTMPVDLKITTVSGDTLVTLWVDGAHEVYDLVLASEPTAVAIDPDNWILNTAEEVPHAGVGEGGSASEALGEPRLEQNAPNPFGPVTGIEYSVPSAQHVRLEIYSSRGQRIACLLDRIVPQGTGQVTWNGTDDRGREVAPGTYFCRLSSVGGDQVTRMILLR
ncbi:MAG: M1 family aminopeptidase [Candidatus Eisenbacteria bacterium]